MRGICMVAVRFERGSRCIECLRRPAQVARDERDLGLGDDASRAGHGLFRAEGTCRTSQEILRSNEIAELRHRDASKRERRRIVAQRDPVQCAEGITRGERTRRGRDQRVHRNPATLVTPTVRCSVLIYLTCRIENGTNDAAPRPFACPPYVVNSTLGIIESKLIRKHAEKHDLLSPPKRPSGPNGREVPRKPGFFARLQAIAEEKQRELEKRRKDHGKGSKR